MSDKQIDFSGLFIKECGKEKSTFYKLVNSKPKDFYLLHYITKGKGTYAIRGEKYQLTEGDFFFVPKGEIVTYSPCKSDPWSYVWIGFDGNAADYFISYMGFSAENPKFRNKDSRITTYFKAINECFVNYGSFEFTCYGYAYLLFSLLMELKKQPEMLTTRERIVLAAKEFIRHNYKFNISMNDVADNIGIQPTYLSKAFIDTLGYSPKKYLTDLKMKYAAEVLKEENCNVKMVGQLVGYEDQLHFSTSFRKYYGVSPLKYRNKYKEIKVND